MTSGVLQLDEDRSLLTMVRRPVEDERYWSEACAPGSPLLARLKQLAVRQAAGIDALADLNVHFEDRMQLLRRLDDTAERWAAKLGDKEAAAALQYAIKVQLVAESPDVRDLTALLEFIDASYEALRPSTAAYTKIERDLLSVCRAGRHAWKEFIEREPRRLAGLAAWLDVRASWLAAARLRLARLALTLRKSRSAVASALLFTATALALFVYSVFANVGGATRTSIVLYSICAIVVVWAGTKLREHPSAVAAAFGAFGSSLFAAGTTALDDLRPALLLDYAIIAALVFAAAMIVSIHRLATAGVPLRVAAPRAVQYVLMQLVLVTPLVLLAASIFDPARVQALAARGFALTKIGFAFYPLELVALYAVAGALFTTISTATDFVTAFVQTKPALRAR